MSGQLCIQPSPLQSLLKAFFINERVLAELVRLNNGLNKRGRCWSCQAFDVGALSAYWQETPCGCCLISSGNRPNVCSWWNLCIVEGILLSLPSKPSFSHWQPARYLFSGSELSLGEGGHVIWAGVPTLLLFSFCPPPILFFLVTVINSA